MVQLWVVAAPSIAAPVRAIADSWAATHPSAGGRCVTVAVDIINSASEFSRLASSASGDSTIWIPDSTLWAARLPAGTVHVDPPIATSPLVLVAPPNRTVPAASWSDLLTGKLPATIPDPAVSTDGLLGLLGLRAAVGSGPTANAQLVGVMIALSHAKLPSASVGFAALASAPASAPIFAASEQEVISANRARHTVFARAIYPQGGTPSLDFPFVRLVGPDADPAVTAATAAFETQLRTAAAQARLADAGLRDPAGHAVAGPADGVQPADLPPSAEPTATQAVETLRMWGAASQDSRLLAVIDVSGSMGDITPNGQTKIQIVAAAAATGIGFFPSTSELGLWVFSTNQTPTTDWAQLVSLGPLGAKVGNVTRRAALLAADQTMPDRVHGNTALYDTALAAFQEVHNTFDPTKVNSVVLMTDGRNVNPGGLTLDQLISTLRAQSDPARPVPIITIGIGSDVDVAALQAISAVTGGKTYIVRNPADIRGVFLDAILQRECRPNC
jgi:Ca-activated chloride channel family protein